MKVLIAFEESQEVCKAFQAFQRPCPNNGGDCMTQKQFIKQLMSRGVSHSDACGLVAYMKELRQLIEKHEDVVMLADANTMRFVPAKVYSYEETFQRMQEGRDIFC